MMYLMRVYLKTHSITRVRIAISGTLLIQVSQGILSKVRLFQIPFYKQTSKSFLSEQTHAFLTFYDCLVQYKC